MTAITQIRKTGRATAASTVSEAFDGVKKDAFPFAERNDLFQKEEFF